MDVLMHFEPFPTRSSAAKERKRNSEVFLAPQTPSEVPTATSVNQSEEVEMESVEDQSSQVFEKIKREFQGV